MLQAKKNFSLLIALQKLAAVGHSEHVAVAWDLENFPLLM